VDHRHGVGDLVRLGADVERAVLSRAVLCIARTASSDMATKPSFSDVAANLDVADLGGDAPTDTTRGRARRNCARSDVGLILSLCLR